MTFSETLTSLIEPDSFLVCGLGSLGQHCVMALKKFGVKAIAIEQTRPPSWEFSNLESQLDALIIGDCRQDNILETAKIRQCRAAIIVTTSEQVNVETALAIRQLNPYTRIVLRSAKANLNHLLEEQLGNLIAYESTELPASAFALAALGTEVLGYFFLDGQRIRIIQRQVVPDHDWCNTRRLYELNSRSQHLLGYLAAENPSPFRFHHWYPETVIRPHDTLIYLELTDIQNQLDSSISSTEKRSPSWQKKINWLINHFFSKQTRQFFQLSVKQQIHRFAVISGMIVLLMLLIGTFLIHLTNPHITLLAAFSGTVILLLGGYGDIFGGFQESDAVPWWLQLFSLGLTLVGTVFVGILYALLTEALLSSQFQFKKNLPPFPDGNHIVLVGLGRVGSKVALFLKDFKQLMVGITLKSDSTGSIFDSIPLIQGFTKDSLSKANIATAKSVVIVTDDEILNLVVCQAKNYEFEAK